MRENKTLNLEIDPPPDLAIEIDITSTSVDKMSIYLSLGIAELWRYDGEDLIFYQLVNGRYMTRENSIAFPIVSIREMKNFLEQSKTMGEIALLKSFRAWVRRTIRS